MKKLTLILMLLFPVELLAFQITDKYVLSPLKFCISNQKNGIVWFEEHFVRDSGLSTRRKYSFNEESACILEVQETKESAEHFFTCSCAELARPQPQQ